MSSRDSSRAAVPSWCVAVSRLWVRLQGARRRRAYLTAATVPLLLLLWPWGGLLRGGGALPAGVAPAPIPIPASSSSASSSSAQAPAEQVAPDSRQRLATLKGAGAAADQVPPISTYTVQAGDTLSGVAARFGTDVASLERVNNLNNYSVLQLGQRLTVLDRVGWLYTVKGGDSVSSVAAATGVSVAALDSANNLSGASPVLQPGEQLLIPKEPTVLQPVATAASAGAGGSGGGLIWPVHGVITSPFGWRPDPWTGTGRFFHHGIDIGVPMRTPVAAACSGRVILAGWDGGYGEAVEISCDSGLITLYAHNSVPEVHYGETVAQGDLIAYSGMTGNATGPHVHFGVMQGGVWQNPMNYLP